MRVITAVFVFALVVPSFALAANEARRDLDLAKQAAPDPEHGAELYRACISCHGADGNGQANGNVPRIAGQHYSVLLKQIVDFRYGKRWDFRMEQIANQHTLEGPQDIADLAAYVTSLERGGSRGIGEGTYATDGAILYGQRCASCHRPDGSGDAAKAIPRLAGQHYDYLLRQMYDAVDGRRPTLDKVHVNKIEPLDFQQVRALADFLSRIGWNPDAN
jgi:cytochrome c553